MFKRDRAFGTFSTLLSGNDSCNYSDEGNLIASLHFGMLAPSLLLQLSASSFCTSRVQNTDRRRVYDANMEAHCAVLKNC